MQPYIGPFHTTPFSSRTGTPMTAIHQRLAAIAQPSSPLSTPPSSDAVPKQGSQLKRPQLRRARPLEFVLIRQAQNYYEENLLTAAFNLLTSIVSNSISSNPELPVLIPPPTHLAVAATISVHPNFTTRTTVREKWEQSSAALRLLNIVTSTVGSIESKLADAFKFTKYDSRSSRSTRRSQDEDRAEEQRDGKGISSRYAKSDSVWSSAEDFWQIVGWTFNCSCLPDMYFARWQHWHTFLTFVIQTLEADWELHYQADTVEESLIWQYIETASSGWGRQRRMMRAIFADGSPKSLREFREVFSNELKPPPQKETGLKNRKEVEVLKDEFADYLDEDSDFSDSESNADGGVRSRTRTPSASGKRTSSRASSRSSASETNNDSSSSLITSNLGPSTAITLRIRLLQLLSHCANYATLHNTSPSTFPDLKDLYDTFIEWIKPLPLPLFQQIVSPSTPHNKLGIDEHTTLCEYLLQSCLESAAPNIRNDPFLGREKLIAEYLPFAASDNSVQSQAKVGLLLEALVRISADSLFKAEDAEELLAAINVGAEKREAIARESMSRGGRKSKKAKNSQLQDSDIEEREAWKWLRESATRMRVLVELLDSS